MTSTAPAIVIYAGSAATYICEEGDVQPTYPTLPPFTEELLRSLQQSQSAVPHTKQNVTFLVKYFFPLLRRRTVVLVLPLSSTTGYREEWVRFCFHAAVQVRHLVVLSDTVADSFACGQVNCAVLHVSLHGVSVSRVSAGCSTRYGNSHVGSLHALCGDGVTAKVVELLPRAAAAKAVRNAEAQQQRFRREEESDDTDEDVDGAATVEWSFANDVDLGVDLTDLRYRDALVYAFGYRAYRAVIVAPQQQQLDAASQRSMKGKGKGKGQKHASSLLDKLRQSYPREVREAPGQLEKLLARVVQGGSEEGVAGVTTPCILAGEALALPFMQQLYTYLIHHCGSAVWDAVEEERRAKQRRMRLGAKEAEYHAMDNRHSGGDESENAKAQSGGEACHKRAAAGADKSFLARPHKRSREEATDLSSSSGSTDEDATSDSDDEEESEEELWLHRQPTPLPTAPWWLPLLGASVLSRLAPKDLQRASILEEEARESNGTVVHWKMLL